MKINRFPSLLLSAVILLVMFALALTSMAQKAPTFDEQGFIVRGLGYLRGYPQIRVGHPAGLNLLNASFLASDESVDLPIDHPSWSGTSFHRPAELFLWEIGNDVRHIMFLARLPTLWLGLLLAALSGRWAWQLTRQIWPGIFALIFVAFDPNILAHMRLSTTDLGLAAFSFLAGYTLWRYLEAPNWKNILIAGIALGLLQNTKFTATLFIPLFAIVILVGLGQMWAENRRSQNKKEGLFSTIPWRPFLMLLIAYPIIAFFTLWAVYGFNIGTLPADLPILSFLSGRTLPMSLHLEQLLDIGGRLQVSTPSFLLGQYSDSGWWYYFLVALLLKSPLPTLILIAWGVIVFAFSRFRFKKENGNHLSALDSSALLFPAGGYFAIALTTDINLGYRHILPILPFLIVFSVTSIFKVVSWDISLRNIATVSMLAIWLMFAALFIYPDFLAYFNVLAGGPDNGWRYLVDSNLDWGQDLDDLAPWMAENGVDQVWLSYFGEARPEYYGIEYEGLDSFPPRLMNPQARPFYPFDPAPGIYAISATNLQGVHFADHDQYAWFKDNDPLDKLGYSIFIYEVEPSGEAVDLLLSGIQLDEILPEDFSRIDSNDVSARWFDISQVLIIPSEGPAWLVIGDGEDINARVEPYLESLKTVANISAEYQMYRFPLPEFDDDTMVEFSSGDGRIQLMDVDVSLEKDTTVRTITSWEQIGRPQPLKFFIHAIDQDGQLIAQWDGFGAAWEGWRTGDRLIHVHEIEMPVGLDSEDYDLLIGVYDPNSGRRWLLDEGTDTFQLE